VIGFLEDSNLSTPAPVPENRICNACASSIDQRARLCPVCKTWQKGWKNWLPYLGGIIALVSIVGSSAIFMISHLRRAPRPVVNLAVLDMTDPGTVTVLNTGDVDVVVTDIMVFCKTYGMGESKHVSQFVRHGEVETIQIGEERNKQKVSPVKSTPELTSEVVNDPKVTKLYTVYYFSRGHASLWFGSMSNTFKSEDAEATLAYVPTVSKAQPVWVHDGFYERCWNALCSLPTLMPISLEIVRHEAPEPRREVTRARSTSTGRRPNRLPFRFAF
jgi:hypothetical protein